MKILIDECLPRKLKHEFPGHEVRTVPEMGWASKKNGELLALMSGQFDVFLTKDNNLQHQHTLSQVSIALFTFTPFVYAENVTLNL
jgi:predicted nuclease of predicted toxin-antitoxin system